MFIYLNSEFVEITLVKSCFTVTKYGFSPSIKFVFCCLETKNREKMTLELYYPHWDSFVRTIDLQ